MGWLVAPVGRLPPAMGLARSPPRDSPALALLHRVLHLDRYRAVIAVQMQRSVYAVDV